MYINFKIYENVNRCVLPADRSMCPRIRKLTPFARSSGLSVWIFSLQRIFFRKRFGSKNWEKRMKIKRRRWKLHTFHLEDSKWKTAASFDQKEKENGRREHYSADSSSIQKTLITDRKRKTKGERRERERDNHSHAREEERECTNQTK